MEEFGFNINDINLEFLQATPPKQKVVQRVVTPTSRDNFPMSFSKDDNKKQLIAKRLANIDALLRENKKLKNEKLEVAEQLKDFQKTALEVQQLYEKEKQENVTKSLELQRMKEKYDKIDFELTHKSFKLEQLEAELTDYKHKEKLNKTKIKPSPKKAAKKTSCCDAEVQCQAVELRSQATQHISTMTTRGTSTSCFIKMRDMGTSCNESQFISNFDDILKEVGEWSRFIPPVSPIIDEIPEASQSEKSENTQKSYKTIGTCTMLCNIRRRLDFIPKLKSSRPASSCSSGQVKQELPTPSVSPIPPPMTSTDASNIVTSNTVLPTNSVSQINPLVNNCSVLNQISSPAFSELWNIFGNMVFGLLQSSNAGIAANTTLSSSSSSHQQTTTNQQQFHNWLRELYNNTQTTSIPAASSSTVQNREDNSRQSIATSPLHFGQSSFLNSTNIIRPQVRRNSVYETVNSSSQANTVVQQIEEDLESAQLSNQNVMRPPPIEQHNQLLPQSSTSNNSILESSIVTTGKATTNVLNEIEKLLPNGKLSKEKKKALKRLLKERKTKTKKLKKAKQREAENETIQMERTETMAPPTTLFQNETAVDLIYNLHLKHNSCADSFQECPSAFSAKPTKEFMKTKQNAMMASLFGDSDNEMDEEDSNGSTHDKQETNNSQITFNSIDVTCSHPSTLPEFNTPVLDSFIKCDAKSSGVQNCELSSSSPPASLADKQQIIRSQKKSIELQIGDSELSSSPSSKEICKQNIIRTQRKSVELKIGESELSYSLPSSEDSETEIDEDNRVENSNTASTADRQETTYSSQIAFDSIDVKTCSHLSALPELNTPVLNSFLNCDAKSSIVDDCELSSTSSPASKVDKQQFNRTQTKLVELQIGESELCSSMSATGVDKLDINEMQRKSVELQIEDNDLYSSSPPATGVVKQQIIRTQSNSVELQIEHNDLSFSLSANGVDKLDVNRMQRKSIELQIEDNELSFSLSADGVDKLDVNSMQRRSVELPIEDNDLFSLSPPATGVDKLDINRTQRKSVELQIEDNELSSSSFANGVDKLDINRMQQKSVELEIEDNDLSASSPPATGVVKQPIFGTQSKSVELQIENRELSSTLPSNEVVKQQNIIRTQRKSFELISNEQYSSIEDIANISIPKKLLPFTDEQHEVDDNNSNCNVIDNNTSNTNAVNDNVSNELIIDEDVISMMEDENAKDSCPKPTTTISDELSTTTNISNILDSSLLKYVLEDNAVAEIVNDMVICSPIPTTPSLEKSKRGRKRKSETSLETSGNNMQPSKRSQRIMAKRMMLRELPSLSPVITAAGFAVADINKLPNNDATMKTKESSNKAPIKSSISNSEASAITLNDINLTDMPRVSANTEVTQTTPTAATNFSSDEMLRIEKSPLVLPLQIKSSTKSLTNSDASAITLNDCTRTKPILNLPKVNSYANAEVTTAATNSLSNEILRIEKPLLGGLPLQMEHIRNDSERYPNNFKPNANSSANTKVTTAATICSPNKIVPFKNKNPLSALPPQMERILNDGERHQKNFSNSHFTIADKTKTCLSSSNSTATSSILNSSTSKSMNKPVQNHSLGLYTPLYHSQNKPLILSNENIFKKPAQQMERIRAKTVKSIEINDSLQPNEQNQYNLEVSEYSSGDENELEIIVNDSESNLNIEQPSFKANKLEHIRNDSFESQPAASQFARNKHTGLAYRHDHDFSAFPVEVKENASFALGFFKERSTEEIESASLKSNNSSNCSETIVTINDSTIATMQNSNKSNSTLSKSNNSSSFSETVVTINDSTIPTMQNSSKSNSSKSSGSSNFSASFVTINDSTISTMQPSKLDNRESSHMSMQAEQRNQKPILNEVQVAGNDAFAAETKTINVHGNASTTMTNKICDKSNLMSASTESTDEIYFESPRSPSPATQQHNENKNLTNTAIAIPLHLDTSYYPQKGSSSLFGSLIANYSKESNSTIYNRTTPKKQKEILNLLRNQLKIYCNCEMELDYDLMATKCARTLSDISQDSKTTCKAIVHTVQQSEDPKVVENELPSIIQEMPPRHLSRSLKRLFYLLKQFHLQNANNICTELQTLCEHTLFKAQQQCKPMSLHAYLGLTQLWLCTAKLQEIHMDRHPARYFLAKVLYYLKEHSPLLAHELLMWYPTILPHREDQTYDRSDALITVLQQLLMNTKYDMHNSELRGKSLISKLRFEYHFEIYKPTLPETIENLVQKIKYFKLENIFFAWGILCKRLPHYEIEAQILQAHLLPLANDYYQQALESTKCDIQIATLLEIISALIKPFPQNAFDVSFYLNLFNRFLTTFDRQLIHEAALCSILRLQNFGFILCYNVLKSLKPLNYMPKETTQAMLKTFLHRKPLSFWEKVQNQNPLNV